MNILFLTSPAPEYAPFSTKEKRPPLGVGFLMAVAKRAGHEVYFSDEYLAPTGIIESGFLEENAVDVVGIYSNTICLPGTLDLIAQADSRRAGGWRGKIAVGGPHTSVGADKLPASVDHIVIGEGERTILDILGGMASGRIIHGERVEDLDTLPMPAWEEFIHRPYDWKSRFTGSYPVYTMNTSRGCPFDCTFCSVNSVWGKTYRHMSAGRVVDDVEHMIKYYGARCIYFREDHFTLNKKRTVEFCDTLLSRNVKIDWLCETRADQLDDEEYQRLMYRAGCRAFYIGVESGSQRMLDFFNKGENVDQFVRAFETARKVGIKTYASFVVGAPTETEDDLRQTFELIDRLKADFVGMNVYTGIPGSRLYDYAIDNGLVEFMDSNGVAYLKGHDGRVDRFYGGDPAYKIPHSLSAPRTIARLASRIRRRLCGC